MKLIGLTGGIGSGKSTSAAILERNGVAVIDTDMVARQVVAPGEPALGEIVAAFGPAMIGPDGELRRSALAELVFADPSRREMLEGILHPKIRERWLQQVSTWRGAGVPIGVVVIPLLFETQAQGHFDAVVCTACTVGSQSERLRARNWNDTEIDRRRAAQWSMDRKMGASNHVIWTEGSLEIHASQVMRLLHGFRANGPISN